MRSKILECHRFIGKQLLPGSAFDAMMHQCRLQAFAAMNAAAAARDVSTVDELLMITPRERRDRTARVDAVRRWRSDDL